MIEEQQKQAMEIRQAEIDELVARLAAIGYQIVLAIAAEDVAQRLKRRQQGMAADGLSPEQRKTQQMLDPDDFETLNYLALNAACLLHVTHLEAFTVDKAIDKAIRARVATLKGR